MQDTKNLPLTLTVSKAAKLLGWSRGKVYNQIERGRIRVHKMGDRMHIITSELMEDISK
jgi:excisionase family DNA binding protein